MTLDKRCLTTTLNKLISCGFSEKNINNFLYYYGKNFDHNKEINLLQILEINTSLEMIWTFRPIAENCQILARLIAADCAESVLYYERENYNYEEQQNIIKASKNLNLSSEELLDFKKSAVFSNFHTSIIASINAAYSSATNDLFYATLHTFISACHAVSSTYYHTGCRKIEFDRQSEIIKKYLKY